MHEVKKLAENSEGDQLSPKTCANVGTFGANLEKQEHLSYTYSCWGDKWKRLIALKTKEHQHHCISRPNQWKSTVSYTGIHACGERSAGLLGDFQVKLLSWKQEPNTEYGLPMFGEVSDNGHISQDVGYDAQAINRGASIGFCLTYS